MDDGAGDSGNRRAGYFIAASFLLILGFGVGVALNILVHITAPSQGVRVFFVTVYPYFGWYAVLVLALGVVSAFIGLGMIWLGLNERFGRLSLPDTEGPPTSATPAEPVHH